MAHLVKQTLCKQKLQIRFVGGSLATADAQASAEPNDTAVETRWVDTAQTNPQAQENN